MHIDDFNTYQRESRKTWSLIHTDHAIVYPTLGLANEAGEVAGKVKKIFRDRAGARSGQRLLAIRPMVHEQSLDPMFAPPAPAEEDQ